MKNTVGAPVFQNGGFVGEGVNPLFPVVTSASQQITGAVIGLFPLRWIDGILNTKRIYGGDSPEIDVQGAGKDSTGNPQAFLTYRVQYQDPKTTSNQWVTYDEKYTEVVYNLLTAAVTDKVEAPFGGFNQSLTTVSRPSNPNNRDPGFCWQTWADPRTSRFGAITFSHNKDDPNYNAPGVDSADWLDQTNLVLVSNRPDTASGFPFPPAGRYLDSNPNNKYPRDFMVYKNPGLETLPDNCWLGLLSENTISGSTRYSDADGVVRRAAGAFAEGSQVGLPMASNNTPSRPYILNRPFRSVAELGYAFSGTPWKNLDFFTPESGQPALLDAFCIEDIESPSPLAGGKVNLNTRQVPVLKAILTGAYKDVQNPAADTLDAATAEAIAQTLVSRTASTETGKGPMRNLSELVGKWVSQIGTTEIDGAQSYDGFSADLTSVFANERDRNIQRFRESAVRALANTGQTRVWNLMIDLIAQTGQYPEDAGNLEDFVVQGEHRYWLQVAIDRYTGEILEERLEEVPGLALTSLSVLEDQPPGTTVATLSATDPDGGILTFALIEGAGSEDNASFTIAGNTLQTTAQFQYFAKDAYNVRIRVTDQNGVILETPFTITVQPGPYNAWKIANFGASANNPAVAGDLVDLEHDALPSLVEYALGTSPLSPDVSGISFEMEDATLRMNYIFREGRLVATVKKHHFTLFRCKFTVDVPGPEDLEAQGSFLDYSYRFMRGGRDVAEVSKRWFTFRDTYGVEIAEGEDDVLILASAVVIDMVCHADDSHD